MTFKLHGIWQFRVSIYSALVFPVGGLAVTSLTIGFQTEPKKCAICVAVVKQVHSTWLVCIMNELLS